MLGDLFTFSHCQRKNGIGGEDIALEKIKKQNNKVLLNIFSPPNNQILGLFLFIFSPYFFYYVMKNRNRVHVIANPFPNVSILSIILIGLFGIKLRYYIHDFSASCPANTHFRNDKQCFRYLKNKSCLRASCVPSRKHLVLNIFRHYIFFRIFKTFKKNKVYFVSPYQRNLALKSGLIKSKTIIAGNL